jgi:hypothetical protein
MARPKPKRPAALARNPSTHSLVAQLDHRLSIIAEDESAVPAASPVTSRTSRSSRAPLLLPSRAGLDRCSFLARLWADPPPSLYSVEDASSGSRGEKLIVEVRANRHVAGRGGWRRLAAFVLLAVAVVVAVAVGLTLGLRKRGGGDGGGGGGGGGNTPPSTPPPNSTAFPAGSYALTAFLYNVSTDCTANPATYSCPPYALYADGAAASMVTFDWTIASSAAGAYTISAANTPFTIDFANVSLGLVGAGTADEHYAFVAVTDTFVSPAAAITADGTAAGCWYNGTRLQGSLYTRKPATASAPAPAHANASSASGLDGVLPVSAPVFRPWPYAVAVQQSIGGGVGVPSCYEMTDGAPVTEGLAPRPSGDLCSCLWKNFGT